MIISSPASFKFDDYQQAIIDCNDAQVVGEAIAGSGKTATAVGVAQARPKERILYLCLNKANATEASRRFPSNVDCRTSHSLAFSGVGRFYKDRITVKWRPRLVADEMNIARPRDAATAMDVLANFFSSTDTQITEAHVEDVAAKWNMDSWEASRTVGVATKLWERMCDRADKISLPHDAYLKMYALSQPQLAYDRVIVDEAQDTNPVTAQIVLAQRHAKLLLVGDRHQSIYAFRGATNAMEEFAGMGATVLRMPRTWRFGQRTADIANALLSSYKEESNEIIGMGKDAPYKAGSPFAVLSRTNAQLFAEAISSRGKGVHWVGGIEGYKVESVCDTYRLYSRDFHAIKDPMLRRYTSWNQFTDEAADTKDAEAKILIKLVDTYGHDIPRIVEDMRRNEVHDKNQATRILATAHKSKGLEFDYVQMAADFNEKLADADEEILQQGFLSVGLKQEINLLYVSVTRARMECNPNQEIQVWLEGRKAEKLAKKAVTELKSSRSVESSLSP